MDHHHWTTTITTPIGTAHVISQFDGYFYCIHFADEVAAQYRPAQMAVSSDKRGFFFKLWKLEKESVK